MAHRGPDGAHHVFMGPVALGHRALNTTPESWAENQPLSDETVGLCLTFDGRIDNRKELKASLETASDSPHLDSDAALVLAAYRRWGEECPAHLLGDFAFAIWDERRQQLFCARDPLGVRPLFYAVSGSTFVCASEIRPLYALPDLKSEPNLAIVALRLARKCVEFDDTIYKGISRLPMAHSLTITRNDIQRRRYWDIDPGHQIRYRNDDEYAEHFRELFFDAVGSRLRSSGPIAAMLSGGLDSSSIVCTADRIRKQRGTTEPKLETFSMVYDHLVLCDERPFINEVIQYCEAKANFHFVDRDPEDAAISRQRHYPGMLYSPHAMVLTSMLETMKTAGFRVLLDGAGGDELAGAFYRHVVSLTRRGKWLSLAAFLRENSAHYELPFWKVVRDVAVRRSIPAPIKWLYRQMVPEPERAPGIVPEEALASTGALDRLAQASLVIPEFLEPWQSEMYAILFSGWNPIVYTDANELNASFFGIELRQPFRDRRLVEFALALPYDQLWRDGWSRFAFRNAMKGTLPEVVRRRRGKGMFVALYEWVLTGSQASQVRALFQDSILVKLGVVDAEVVRNLIKEYQIRPVHAVTPTISDLVTLEIACREILGETTFRTGADEPN